MRLFVIADASKRKAKPVAVLLWRPSEDREQGVFTLEVATGLSARVLPLSLSFCTKREGNRASAQESEEWARSRVVPEDRQNIAEVLRANGLSRYSVVDLLALSGGVSSDDDLRAYEVALPDYLAKRLEEGGEDSPTLDADSLLAAVERRRGKPEVHYAFVELEDPEREPSAAERIGAEIRAKRKEAKLTQTELATQVGIAQAVLSRVESGVGNPTLGLLEDIARALDTDLQVGLKAID